MLQLKKITHKEDLRLSPDYLIVYGDEPFIAYWDGEWQNWEEEVVGCFCVDDGDNLYFEDVKEVYEIIKD